MSRNDLLLQCMSYVFLPISEFVPKTKLRKVERKLAPVAEKMSVEELMETNTYQRFIRSIELMFDNTEDLELNTEMGKVYYYCNMLSDFLPTVI